MKQKETQKNTASAKNSLQKIVINAGIGRLSAQPNFEEKILIQVSRDLSLMTGQKPKICRARKSIAGFKTRQGQIVGLQITLRRQKMIDFFERLTKIVLPRVRDFVGLDLEFIDRQGVLNFGLKEQFVFPEMNPEESLITFPLGINIIPKTKNRDEAILLYRELGVPLKKSTVRKLKNS